MDIVTILILMALFYLVPELLKRGKPKTYEYPQIPDRVPPPDTIPPPGPLKGEGKTVSAVESDIIQLALPPRPEVHPPVEVNPLLPTSEESSWQGRLDQATVLNGIIFAEILQPPRAKRPLRPPVCRR